ncbi:hypothetical protein Aduo_018195 [Ancylostoma duodenale]
MYSFASLRDPSGHRSLTDTAITNHSTRVQRRVKTRLTTGNLPPSHTSFSHLSQPAKNSGNDLPVSFAGSVFASVTAFFALLAVFASVEQRIFPSITTLCVDDGVTLRSHFFVVNAYLSRM